MRAADRVVVFAALVMMAVFSFGLGLGSILGTDRFLLGIVLFFAFLVTAAVYGRLADIDDVFKE